MYHTWTWQDDLQSKCRNVCWSLAIYGKIWKERNELDKELLHSLTKFKGNMVKLELAVLEKKIIFLLPASKVVKKKILKVKQGLEMKMKSVL